ncbi:MAG: cupin domain-containing protein [Actinobacteria bacterium]|nr:cupin domain-containing protein [Actinomycetota bacterium]
MPNIEEPDFVDRDGPPGFRAKRARIGYELGSEAVGVSVWELPPGEAAYPYHFHYSDEEVVIVLRGRPTLRTPAGERVLEQGEAVRFELGPGGAHQISNPTAEPVRFLAVSSHGRPDIVVYPDSNKVGASERGPRGAGFNAFFDLDDAVDYWRGETPPGPPADG